MSRRRKVGTALAVAAAVIHLGCWAVLLWLMFVAQPDPVWLV